MTKKHQPFQIAAHIVLFFLSICVLVPFVLLISSSITEEDTLIRYGYSLLPKKFDLSAYNYLLTETSSIVRGYAISALVTVVGTVANLILTILFAYPLSRKDLPGRNIFSFYLFFTMLFNGGLVSSYMMWTQTFHIKNTIWALIVPNLMMTGFYVIMMRTYFTSNIPDAVIEAARVDGAGEARILVQIVLPMSLPILATVGLMVGIGYWNDWLNGLYYISDDRYLSIQVLLKKMLSNTEMLKRAAASGVVAGQVPSTGIKMSVAVMGALPVLVIYPFFQRYFVKGISVGAVKG